MPLSENGRGLRAARNACRVDDAKGVADSIDVAPRIFNAEVDAVFGRAPAPRLGQPQQKLGAGRNDIESVSKCIVVGGVVNKRDVRGDAPGHSGIPARSDLVDLFADRRWQERRDLPSRHTHRMPISRRTASTPIRARRWCGYDRNMNRVVTWWSGIVFGAAAARTVSRFGYLSHGWTALAWWFAVAVSFTLVTVSVVSIIERLFPPRRHHRRAAAARHP